MLNAQTRDAITHQMPPSKRAVVLAYARFAREDGTNCYPAIKSVAHAARLSERQVRRITGELVADGVLIPDGRGPNGTRRWKIAPDSGDKMSPNSSSSYTEQESLLSFNYYWRTSRPARQIARSRFDARGPKQPPAPPAKRTAAAPAETPTTKLLIEAGVSAAVALAYGWLDFVQVAELVALARKKADRRELRTTQGNYIVGALKRLEEAASAEYAVDVERGTFAGTWDEYREMLAAVQVAPAAPALHQARAGELRGEGSVDDWGDEWADIDEVYGVSLRPVLPARSDNVVSVRH